jgi:hypothetical protein
MGSLSWVIGACAQVAFGATVFDLSGIVYFGFAYLPDIWCYSKYVHFFPF